VTEKNAEQRDYWNGPDSREWVDDAERYDQMLEPFVEPILDAAALDAGARALDVGCGNGATTLAAAARVGGDGEAVGIDLSEPMLANARAAAVDRALANARFEAADAQSAPLDGPFDTVISRFGVMFFDEPDAAWANLVGTLGPGSRLAFVVWRPALENEWVMVQAGAALAHVSAPPEDFGGSGPDGPGPFRYGDPAPLVEGLARAGLEGVEARPFDTTIRLGGRGPLDDVMRFVERSGMTRRLLGEASADERGRALAAVREALVPFAAEDGVRLGAAAWIVSGRRR